MVRSDVDVAWSYLASETKQRVYDNTFMAFAQDVDDADWSRLTWEFGTVVVQADRYEVHVIADAATVPAFLDETGIGSKWSDTEFVIYVQLPYENSSEIVAKER